MLATFFLLWLLMLVTLLAALAVEKYGFQLIGWFSSLGSWKREVPVALCVSALEAGVLTLTMGASGIFHWSFPVLAAFGASILYRLTHIHPIYTMTAREAAMIVVIQLALIALVCFAIAMILRNP